MVTTAMRAWRSSVPSRQVSVSAGPRSGARAWGEASGARFTDALLSGFGAGLVETFFCALGDAFAAAALGRGLLTDFGDVVSAPHEALVKANSTAAHSAARTCMSSILRCKPHA
jgi:hypothetical protein